MSALIERAARIAWAGIAGAVVAELPAPRRRAAAIYLLVTQCNLPGACAARVIGCSKQNISKILRHIEDLREDPAFDRQLTALERRLEG